MKIWISALAISMLLTGCTVNIGSSSAELQESESDLISCTAYKKFFDRWRTAETDDLNSLVLQAAAEYEGSTASTGGLVSMELSQSVAWWREEAEISLHRSNLNPEAHRSSNPDIINANKVCKQIGVWQ